MIKKDYCVYIKGAFIGKGRPRFTRTGVVYTPKKTIEYEKHLRDLLYKEYGDVEPVDSMFKIELILYYKAPKKLVDIYEESKKEGFELSDENQIKLKNIFNKRPDVDNILKTVLDAFNGVIYEDDKQIYSVAIKKEVKSEKENEIIINIFEI